MCPQTYLIELLISNGRFLFLLGYLEDGQFPLGIAVHIAVVAVILLRSLRSQRLLARPGGCLRQLGGDVELGGERSFPCSGVSVRGA